MALIADNGEAMHPRSKDLEPTRPVTRLIIQAHRVMASKYPKTAFEATGGIATAISLGALALESWIYAGVSGGIALTVVGSILYLLPRKKFGALEKRILTEYIEIECSRLMSQLPIDGMEPDRSKEHAIRGGYGYVEPAFSTRFDRPHVQSVMRDGESIVDLTCRSLRERCGFLLIGDPGSGKSLTAAVTFARLADTFMATPDIAPFPIFLRLNALKEVKVEKNPGMTRAEEQADWLRGQIASDLLLPNRGRLARLITAGRIVLVCDGLDEMPSIRAPQYLSTVLPPELIGLFRIPTLLTCRSAFHSIYIDATSVSSMFLGTLELLPFQFEEQGVEFLEWYASARDRGDLKSTLIKVIGKNPSLKETVQRPFVLRMAAEVVFDLVMENKDPQNFFFVGHGCETSSIYSRYIDKWLQREQEKEPALLTWWQKRDLMEKIAWDIFSRSTTSRKGWGHFELKDLLIESWQLQKVVEDWSSTNFMSEGTTEEICREIVSRTFLMVSEDRHRYRFVHKSFYEFCVARHALHELDERSAKQRMNKASILGHPMPDEVIDFIRELLAEVSSSTDLRQEREAIEETFLSIFCGVSIEKNPQALMSAQQAANLLPIVASEQTMRRLRHGDLYPGHPFLQRAIAVADALHFNRSFLLDEFVIRMEADPEAESFHMGYNRIYYGDQSFGSGQWKDDNHPECGRFFYATLRHLELEVYRYIRVMDLYTLRAMLKNPDRRDYLVKRERSRLIGVRTLLLEQRTAGAHDMGSVCDEQTERLLEEIDAHVGDSNDTLRQDAE